MCNCGKNGIKIENQKVLTHDSEWGWELVKDAIFCPFCGENLQPERSKREDQRCNFCLNPESILTPETCCTGCGALNSMET